MFYKAFFFFPSESGKQPLEASWLKLFVEINGCGFSCLQDQSHHMLVLLSETHACHAHTHTYVCLCSSLAHRGELGWPVRAQCG